MSVKLLNRCVVESAAKSAAITVPRRNEATIPPFNHSTIHIANRQRMKKIKVRRLQPIVVALCEELKIAEAELGIHLVGAKEMARVNGQFLQHEGSTDVITFDHLDPASRLPPHTLKIHGELFICVDDAIQQARQFKTRWQAEVVRYLIHGVLHLLGYDDLKPDLRRVMKREENRLVRRFEKRFL